MRLLLDTHALIWAMGASHRLPGSIHRLLGNAQNDIFFSVASIFEIAAKRATGRRHVPGVAAEQAFELAERAGYGVLQITPAHAVAVESIAAFHGDPFDRLLLAQAQIEGMQLVTHDAALASYDSRAILF